METCSIWWTQVDEQNLGLYYLEDEKKMILYLQTHGANPTTLINRNVMYIFIKTNIILEPKIVYLERYNIKNAKVPKEIVSIYYFGGWTLFDAIGRVKNSMLEVSVHSHPKEIAKKIVSGNAKIQEPMWAGIPLPTNTTKVGEGLGMSGGH